MWLERANKTVRERDKEHKKTAAATQKANQEEVATEAAEAEAEAKLEQSQNDLQTRIGLTAEAVTANKEATAKVEAAAKVLDEAIRAENAAKLTYDAAMKALKAAQAKAKKTSIQRAEDELAAAKDAAVKAEEREQNDSGWPWDRTVGGSRTCQSPPPLLP